jgi:hypothetical protein
MASTASLQSAEATRSPTTGELVKLTVTVVGEDTFTVDMGVNETVDDLKRLIEGAKGIPISNQVLKYRGKKLEAGSMQQNNITRRAALLLMKLAVETKEEEAVKVLCRNGCGFWGFAAFFPPLLSSSNRVSGPPRRTVCAPNALRRPRKRKTRRKPRSRRRPKRPSLTW